MRYSRRQFIGGALGTAVAWPSLAAAARQTTDPPPVFRHGVASGDPLDRSRDAVDARHAAGRDAVVGAAACDGVVADDERLERVVASGTVETAAARDFTVKVDAGGLRAGRTYYYAFDTAGERSPVGRTKTLPQDDVARLRLASVSCSNYPAGYFNVYPLHRQPRRSRRGAAPRRLHLRVRQRRLRRRRRARAAYRCRPARRRRWPTTAMRYATYRSDVDLQAAHRGASVHRRVGRPRGDQRLVARRRAAAHGRRRRLGARASPPACRPIANGCRCGSRRSGEFQLYRSFRFGRLADLHDARHAQLPRPAGARPRRGGAGRSRRARSWARRRRSGSSPACSGRSARAPVAADRPADDVLAALAARRRGAEHRRLGRLSRGPRARVRRDRARAACRTSRSSPATSTARGRSTCRAVRSGATPPAPAKGRSPWSWSRRPSARRRSSPAPSMRDATALLQLVTPHLKFFDGEHRGYVLLDVTKARLQSEWYHVPAVDVRSPDEVARGGVRVRGRLVAAGRRPERGRWQAGRWAE